MAAVWTCPTCSKRRRMRFCPRCGEERLRAGDLSVRDLMTQFAKHASSVDGKFMRSWRSLLTTPGALTAAFVKGQRRRYIAPLALFFIGNAAFVGVQSLTDTNILSTPLASHLHSQDWAPFAQSLVSDRLEHRHLSLDAYAPVFDRSALFNAKALVILMALAFAPVLALLFRSSRCAAGVHIVFALHFYAFVLILLSLAVTLAWVDKAAGGQGLESAFVDKGLSVFNLAVCGAYLFLAVGRAYNSSGWPRAAAALVLTIAVALLFIGYRFAIFLITFYTT